MIRRRSTHPLIAHKLRQAAWRFWPGYWLVFLVLCWFFTPPGYTASAVYSVVMGFLCAALFHSAHTHHWFTRSWSEQFPSMPYRTLLVLHTLGQLFSRKHCYLLISLLVCFAPWIAVAASNVPLSPTFFLLPTLIFLHAWLSLFFYNRLGFSLTLTNDEIQTVLQDLMHHLLYHNPHLQGGLLHFHALIAFSYETDDKADARIANTFLAPLFHRVFSQPDLIVLRRTKPHTEGFGAFETCTTPSTAHARLSLITTPPTVPL